MVDKTFFGRLETMFSTSTLVVKGKEGLQVVDINKVQATDKLATNRLVDRYNRLHQSSQALGYNQKSNYHTQRLILFSDYETMDQDPIISSALDIYSEESTLRDEFGDILTIKSSNSKIEETLNNLFYNIMNIEFNLYPWCRNMCKYGDFYLKLEIVEELGIINVIPISTYEMLREEDLDPNNPEYVRFTQDPTIGGQAGGGMGRSLVQSQRRFENYEVAHFRLLSDANFLPYGKSMVEPARKIWKQLTLMEDSMMIHRIMRAPEKRIFKIDIGNIPPNEVDTHMQNIINQTKKAPYIDKNTGQYDLKFNLSNMMEDYYLPVRGGQTGTEIDTLPGMEWSGIDDINYLKEKMFAALKIPKAFIGYEEGVDGKATLAAMDVRFARTIERIQRIMVSELTKVAIVHLYSQGYKDADLVDFELNLTNSSTIHEQEMIELWSQKTDLAQSLRDNKLLSEKWIYENIWKLSDDDITKEKANVVEDTKRKFILTSIENEGMDPSKDDTSATPVPTDTPNDDTDFGGRPKEGPKFGTQDSARGRDPVGDETRARDAKNKDRSISEAEKRYIAKSLFNKKSDDKKIGGMLNEDNILEKV